MAKDVITRFKLETTQFDSKIKNTAKELSDIGKSASAAGKDFGKLTKDSIDAARSFGSMATSMTDAKGKAKELVSAFNDLAKTYNALNKEQQQSDFGKAVSASLTQLQQRIKETKQEMQNLSSSSGGLFGGDKLDGMLQVFGGNLMTKGASLLAGLASDMGAMVAQGVELAKQGEGIRIAFERLGRGDILDGLREATHGTVTDLELMKAAVKFNDFKLPVEELGTMLAFAQQKAKDTGQSVDYMVDSIVTGLGRKSLMILDNLGLSATEVKDRMKETGDMTKAVGAIIRDQMAKAGDYVETAADRAAQANVSLQNKMEELGRKFAPVEEASNQLWTSMKIGILDIIGGPLASLLNGLTEAGRLKNMLNNLNGEGDNTKVGGQLKKLQAIKKAGGSSYMFNSTLSGMMEDYNRQITTLDAQIKNGGKPIGGGSGSSQDVRYLQRQMDALKIMRDELKEGAQGILNPKTQNTTTTTTTNATKKGVKEDKDDFTEIIGLIGMAEERVSDLQKRIKEAPDETTITVLRDQLKEAQADLDRLNGKELDLDKIFPDKTPQSFGSSLSRGDQMAQQIKANIGFAVQDADMSTLRTLMETTIKNGIEGIDIPSDMLIEQIMGEGLDIPDTYWKELEDQINEKLKELGVDPISLDLKTGKSSSRDKKTDKTIEKMSKGISGLNSVLGGVEKMGLQIPAEIQSLMGVIEGAMMIIQGVSTIIGVTQTTATTANTVALTALTAAVWANTASSVIPFATGGIVPHAAGGYFVGGTHMSGDVTPIMANAGELVLNRAQQGNLASQMADGAFRDLNLTAIIRGEQIRLALNNNGRRTGRGEYVQSKNVK